MEISKYQTELADNAQIQANWTSLSQTMLNITGKKKPGKQSRAAIKWRDRLNAQATSIKQTQAFLKKMLKSIQATAVASTESLGSAEAVIASPPKRRRVFRKNSEANAQDMAVREILRSRVTYSEPVDWTRRMPDTELAADNVPEAYLLPDDESQ